MGSARELVKVVMRPVNFDEQRERWRFLNHVFTGIVPYAQLDLAQGNLLLSVLQEVVCGMHTAILSDRQRSMQWAMQIATWVNSAHAATR